MGLEFDSRRILIINLENVSVAQWIEHSPPKRGAGGSSPPWDTSVQRRKPLFSRVFGFFVQNIFLSEKMYFPSFSCRLEKRKFWQIHKHCLLIISRKSSVFANENGLPANLLKKGAKNLANGKSGCLLFTPVMRSKIEYCTVYIERLFTPLGVG